MTTKKISVESASGIMPDGGLYFGMSGLNFSRFTSFVYDADPDPDNPSPAPISARVDNVTCEIDPATGQLRAKNLYTHAGTVCDFAFGPATDTNQLNFHGGSGVWSTSSPGCSVSDMQLYLPYPGLYKVQMQAGFTTTGGTPDYGWFVGVRIAAGPFNNVVVQYVEENMPGASVTTPVLTGYAWIDVSHNYLQTSGLGDPNESIAFVKPCDVSTDPGLTWVEATWVAPYPNQYPIPSWARPSWFP